MEQEMPSSSVSMKRPYFDSQEQDQQYSDNAKKHKQENDETSQEDSGSAKKQKQENDETSQEGTSPVEQESHEEDQQGALQSSISGQEQENCETRIEGLSPASLRTENQENDGTNQVSQDARHCIVYDEKTKSDETDTTERDSHDTTHYPSRHGSSNVEYSHDITGRWQQVFIQRPQESELPGKPNAAYIDVYNVDILFYNFNHVFSCRPDRISQLGAGETFYYHGSNDQGVKNILEKGIDLSMSRRPVDFSCGGGFYVTKDFYRAALWSQRVARRHGGRPAVIAFRINRYLRKEQPHLALKVDTPTNLKQWEAVVSHFRQGGRSRSYLNTELKDVMFIKGPVAKTRRFCYEPHPFKQLCIRDNEYAHRFGSLENIAFVMFLV